MGKLPFLYLFDPGAVDSDRNIVFCLAGGGAGMAADTLPVIYNKAVFHNWVEIGS